MSASSFNRLVRAAEHKRYRELLWDIAQEAKLFEFPEDQALDLTEDALRFFKGDFYLPFPVVAIDDEFSCVVLIDLEPNQIGCHQKRRFIEVCPLGQNVRRGRLFTGQLPPGRRRILEQMADVDTSAYPEDLCYIVGGHVWGVAPKEDVHEINGDVQWCIMLENGRYRDSFSDPMMQRLMRFSRDEYISNAWVAMKEVATFCSPDFFVLKESPQVRPKQRKGKLLRKHERDIYTLLRPREIRQRMGLPEPVSTDRKSPRPHERRRHIRVYKSERYKKMRGKKQIIPATWVGPSESVHKGKRYKVMLDM